MPVLDPELVAERLAVLLVVVAHIGHRDVVLALDQRIAIGELDVSLIVRAVENAALVVLGDVRVLQNPNRVVGHAFPPSLFIRRAPSWARSCSRTAGSRPSTSQACRSSRAEQVDRPRRRD